MSSLRVARAKFLERALPLTLCRGPLPPPTPPSRSLVPLVRKFFSECFRTGLPPLYGSLTPAQEAQRKRLAATVAEFRRGVHQRVVRTLDEQWAEHEALYAVPSAARLAELRARQDATAEALRRQRANSSLTELQLEVRSRAARQHAVMVERDQRRKDDAVRELARTYDAAEARAKERDAVKVAIAESEGMNTAVAMSRRARTLQAARKLVRAATPPPQER